MRLTESRKAIFNIVSAASEPIDVRAIYHSLSNRPNLSTVYRSLDFLESRGMVRSITPFDNTRYYYSNCVHGHFLICTVCRSIMSFPDCPASTVQHDIEMRSGYSITDHVLLFRGICDKCKKRK